MRWRRGHNEWRLSTIGHGGPQRQSKSKTSETRGPLGGKPTIRASKAIRRVVSASAGASSHSAPCFPCWPCLSGRGGVVEVELATSGQWKTPRREGAGGRVRCRSISQCRPSKTRRQAEQRGLAEKGTALNGNSPRKWNDTCDTTGR